VSRPTSAGFRHEQSYLLPYKSIITFKPSYRIVPFRMYRPGLSEVKTLLEEIVPKRECNLDAPRVGLRVKLLRLRNFHPTIPSLQDCQIKPEKWLRTKSLAICGLPGM
jgi:hypothetical protein